jgi:hypothetical protein
MDNVEMRYLKPLLLISSLLTLLLLTSCKPAATPMPTPTLLLSPSPVSAQQVAPTATREVTPSPVATPTIPAAAAKSGIRITAKIGPSCPGPERPGQVCEKPYQGEFSITTSQNTAVIQATTDQDGQVMVELPPGQYTVTPKIEGRFPTGAPVNVTVLTGQIVEVSIELDSGMR